jgi:hypothetical protein
LCPRSCEAPTASGFFDCAAGGGAASLPVGAPLYYDEWVDFDCRRGHVLPPAWRGRADTAAYCGGEAGVISDCHFSVQLNHFIPVFLSYSVAVLLKWQSDITLGEAGVSRGLAHLRRATAGRRGTAALNFTGFDIGPGRNPYI